MRDLIKRLLAHSVTNRLGCLKDGIKDITSHRWFKNLSWDSLLGKTLKAPWKPDITDELDASYYEIALEGSEEEQDIIQPYHGDQALFESF